MYFGKEKNEFGGREVFSTVHIPYNMRYTVQYERVGEKLIHESQSSLGKENGGAKSMNFGKEENEFCGREIFSTM